MTDNAFLIKIIPPEGYNVYRLHVSRTMAVAVLLAFVAVVGAALGFHAWQLHLAENDVQALQAITASQHEKLQAIDRQADSLAGELRAIQRQDDEIRRLLGVHAAPAAAGASDARLRFGRARERDGGPSAGPLGAARARLRAAPVR